MRQGHTLEVAGVAGLGGTPDHLLVVAVGIDAAERIQQLDIIRHVVRAGESVKLVPGLFRDVDGLLAGRRRLFPLGSVVRLREELDAPVVGDIDIVGIAVEQGTGRGHQDHRLDTQRRGTGDPAHFGRTVLDGERQMRSRLVQQADHVVNAIVPRVTVDTDLFRRGIHGNVFLHQGNRAVHPHQIEVEIGFQHLDFGFPALQFFSLQLDADLVGILQEDIAIPDALEQATAAVHHAIPVIVIGIRRILKALLDIERIVITHFAGHLPGINEVPGLLTSHDRGIVGRIPDVGQITVTGSEEFFRTDLVTESIIDRRDIIGNDIDKICTSRRKDEGRKNQESMNVFHRDAMFRMIPAGRSCTPSGSGS